VIAVEGNGPRKTFLDELGLDAVFYTHSNKFPTGNYGTKEFLDIMQCIFHFNMQDHDFVVKMTGRYYLDENCPFMDSIQMLSNPDYQYVPDVVFRSGTSTPSEMHDYKQDMCHTSLIGMRVYYLRNIGQLDAPPCSPVEKYWVLVIRQIPQDKQRILKQLGYTSTPHGAVPPTTTSLKNATATVTDQTILKLSSCIAVDRGDRPPSRIPHSSGHIP